MHYIKSKIFPAYLNLFFKVKSKEIQRYPIVFYNNPIFFTDKISGTHWNTIEKFVVAEEFFYQMEKIVTKYFFTLYEIWKEPFLKNEKFPLKKAI